MILCLAPGDSIAMLSSVTPGSGWKIDRGTSFSPPMVAGVAGLVVAEDPSLRLVPDPAFVKDAILDGADTDVGDLSGKIAGGRRLNATGALP